MADDYINQALQASLANNPFVQFGSLVSQTKNPYAGNDPWKALAATAAQGFIGGLAGGYGQGQVKQDIQTISPYLSQMAAQPGSFENPGIDQDLFTNLTIGAQKEKIARDAKIADLFQTEAIKAQLSPDAALNNIKTQREKLDLLRELEWAKQNNPELYKSLSGKPKADAPQVEAPRAVPTPQQVFGELPGMQPVAEKKAMPMAEPSPLRPATPQVDLLPVPEVSELMKNYPTLSYKDAQEQALAEQKAIKAENLRIQRDARKASLEQPKEAGKDSMADWLEGTSKAFNRIDAPVAAMEAALPKMPDFGGVLGGAKEFVIENVARLPEAIGGRGGAAQAAQEALAARTTITSATPQFLGEIRKEVLPGALSEKELQFLFSLIPTEYKTPGENIAAVNNMKVARDLLKFEKNFKQALAKRGFNKQQIIQKFEETRNAMGGSFLNGTQLNPTVYELTDSFIKGEF